MSFKSKAEYIARLARDLVQQPVQTTQILSNLVPTVRGFNFSKSWSRSPAARNSDSTNGTTVNEKNPLREYYDQYQEGPGIWKWEHYFDIYHRHLNKFRGREVCVLEIGIFSGGSLGMWRSYLGPKCNIVGVDIEPACKVYEGDRMRVFIGDQADRNFWKTLREQVPVVDILIDDGGHVPEQQIVTLEEMLPHLSPGGVFICEDVRGVMNQFSACVYGIADNLNAAHDGPPRSDNHRIIESKPNDFQRDVLSVHLYPYVTVIEKSEKPVDRLIATTKGTQWQPYL